MSTAAFCAEFRSAYRVLWMIALATVREPALAEDTLQEAVMVALGKLHEFEPGTNFGAWMGRIVRFVGLNQSRRERRHQGVALHESDQATNPVSRLLVVDHPPQGDLADFDRRVHLALAEVSENARACLLLRTLEGLSYASISELLGIPEGTAMSHVHRTRQFLRGRLSTGGADPRQVERAKP